MLPGSPSDWLLIVPCCARKIVGRSQGERIADPLANLVSPERYTEMIGVRRAVMQGVQANSKFTTEKYFKNRAIKDGADFGGHDMSGFYMPALERYAGSLYSVSGLKVAIERVVKTQDGPQVMILSALYGPLHPLSPIQDYNLMMQDAPARNWVKAFPAFLSDYAQRNRVNKIGLYLGSSTAYLKVAAKAVTDMRRSGLILEAVQYHIVDGNTRATPLKHGSRLLCDLGGPFDQRLYDPVQVYQNAL